MKTIQLFVITALLASGAEAPKQPKPLSDKQRADAALAMASMERAIREFSAADAARTATLKAAQDAARAFQDVQAKLRQEAGAPDGCRLDEVSLAWIREIKGPEGQPPTKAVCEIESPKPEGKK